MATCSEHYARFDFDEWAELAAKDPGAFEQRRAEVLAEAIENAPAHRRARLRGLQWQIDQMRATAGTPLAACVRISNMMWDCVAGDDGLLARMEALKGQRSLPRNRRKAKVLPFRRQKPH